jgi:hypothetical protein
MGAVMFGNGIGGISMTILRAFLVYKMPTDEIKKPID